MIKKRLSIFLAGLMILSPLTVLAQATSLPGLDQLPGIFQTINQTQSVLNNIPSVPITAPKTEAKEVGISVFGIVTLPFSYNQLAIGIGKIVVNQVVNSTVRWMNSGFDDKPAYVTDPGNYFGSLADGIAGDYLNQVQPGICSAFSAKIILALRNTDTQDFYPQCTLSQIGVNFENFKQSFSNGGGWDAWFAVTQNSNNNPYEIYLDAQGALNNKVSQKINAELTKLNWGQGFKGVSICKQYNGFPTIPGTPYNPNYGPGECVEYGEENTPGALIKSHLDKVLPANNYLESIVTADQFDKLLSALANGLLQKFVFKQGGLLGVSGSSNSGSDDVSTSSGNDQSIQCFPNTNAVVINDKQVTWNAFSSENNTITQFTNWIGEKINGTEGPIAKTVYDSAGRKEASVVASTTRVNELGEYITSSHNTRTIPCSQSVLVTKYRPLSVSCSPIGNPNDFWSDETIRYPNVTGVEWKANITGGSGEFTGIEWGGDQDFVPGTNNDHNRIWPNRYGAPNAVDQTIRIGNVTNILHKFDLKGSTRFTQGEAASSEKITQTKNADGTTLTEVILKRPYYKDGKDTQVIRANITVVDKDLSLESVIVQCNPSYTLIDR